MSWTDWAKLAVDLYGAYSANKGNKDATNATVAGSQAAIDEQRREYDQSRTDQLPWLTAGTAAIGQMGALNSGDFSSFHNSPDYQFALDQGMKTLDRSAASRGRLYSGGYGEDLTKYAQGMAEQNYNNFYNRLQSMAGQGQTTATNLGTLGQSMASNIGSQYNNIGNARASGYGYNAYNNANTATTLAKLFDNWGNG